MKTGGWTGALLATIAVATPFTAQTPNPPLSRPGLILVADLTGDVAMTTGAERTPLKVDGRVPAGATVFTGRRSIATLVMSNGSTIQLGPESELEIVEYLQAPFSTSLKVAELKEEPSVSQTDLRLARGDVRVEVKSMKVSRGSTFTLALVAGSLRIMDGVLAASVNMTELGLGMCMLELTRGHAQFEPATGPEARAQPMPVGTKIGFAVEVERGSGKVKLSELPKPSPAKAPKSGG